MSLSLVLALALLGGLVGLDVVSFPQAMISRPIVAATLGGALLGRPVDGMLMGVVLELLALETLPVGAAWYPEWASAAVVGGALFAARAVPQAGSLALAMLAAAIVGTAVLMGAGNPMFVAVEAAAVAVAVAGYRILTPKRVVPERADKVGRLLEELTCEGWRVLHDVCTGVRSVDHIAVGPAGVFTVKVMGMSGIERSDHTDRGLISQAYAQSQWVGRAVGTQVEPLLVFSRALVVPSASQHWSVWVMSACALPRHLRKLERTLSAPEVDATFERLGLMPAGVVSD